MVSEPFTRSICLRVTTEDDQICKDATEGLTFFFFCIAALKFSSQCCCLREPEVQLETRTFTPDFNVSILRIFCHIKKKQKTGETQAIILLSAKLYLEAQKTWKHRSPRHPAACLVRVSQREKKKGCAVTHREEQTIQSGSLAGPWT